MIPRPEDTKAHVVRVAGRRVRIHVAGAGEPLLLLNGLARPLESWRPFSAALRGRTVITFDAPGVGGSPTPLLPMTIPMLAGLAASVLERLAWETADVLGFSHGGAVAQQLAVHAPDKVNRLMLVSTSCGVGATANNHGALRNPLAGPNTTSWPRPHLVGLLWHSLAISSWSSIPFLGAIQHPTLVICGRRDMVVPPANSVLLTQRIPNADLVMLTAGHDLQRRGHAQVLARTVEQFLAA